MRSEATGETVDPDSPAVAPEAVPTLLRAEPITDQERSRENEDFLDDLQEAAAGLAMLMRSSPVADRTAPVVFAPGVGSEGVDSDGEPASSESVMPEGEKEIEDPEASSEARPEERVPSSEAAPVDSETEEAVDDGFSVDEPAEEESGPEEGESRAAVSVLGEEVIEQFGRIDNGLDALEDLVTSIENSLGAFDSLAEGDDPEGETLSVVSEAA